MTPDNYKQSFTDDSKKGESGKIQKKVFEIIKKKNHFTLQRVLYIHVHKYHNCKW